mgnify:FL=1|jgi:hypothetical protein
MKNLFYLLLGCLFFTISVNGQTFISDHQSRIARSATESEELGNEEKRIILDTTLSTISIEMPDGSTFKSHVSYVHSPYEAYGVKYAGYYLTSRGEKIYIRNKDIGFHALNTLGYFYTFDLKGINLTKEEIESHTEQVQYKNNLMLHGKYLADCVKERKVVVGMPISLLCQIFEGEPKFEEWFKKDSNVITIVVYANVILRATNLKVDSVIYLN